ncbi:MAG: hypothetical protein HY023_17395 [Chloroflexi bacterium]|nr:hypothetical protein [Chloroflexota bacterium]
MSDLFSKVTGEQNIVERLVSKIPGFSGYQEKENRRAADKLLRQEIARRYEEQWARISQIQNDLVTAGKIDLLDNLEGAALKLRTFVDQMKTASYGYSGFFDAVKVKEDDLAKLYEYDNALLDNVGKVTAAIDNLEASLETDGLPAAIRNLTTIAAQCNTAFEHRTEVLTRG